MKKLFLLFIFLALFSFSNVRQAEAQANFTISSSPPSRTIKKGDITSYTINLTSTGGFAGTVNLSANCPSNSSCSFYTNQILNPNCSTDGVCTLEANGSADIIYLIDTSNSTPLGDYTITFTGTSGALNNSTQSQLTVNTGSTSHNPYVYIDEPCVSGSYLPGPSCVISDNVTILGWAIDNLVTSETAINTSLVKLFVDGVFVGNATYGLNREAVCATYPRPGCPNVGFSYSWNSRSVPNGLHIIRVEATDTDTTPRTSWAEIYANIDNSSEVDIRANNTDSDGTCGANCITIPWNSGTTISWTSTDASSCTISPTGWSGTSGSELTGNLTAGRTYSASCDPGPAVDNITVSVGTQPNSGLTIIKGGQGTVVSSPSGIDCSEDCNETYLPDTLITLTATPDPGRIFTGWLGVTCEEGSQRSAVCTFTMNGDKTVIANFAVHPTFKAF